MVEVRRRHRRNANEPGHAHELKFSCYRGFQFLAKARTCVWLADAINDARTEWSFDLWAFVFMPEHAHLLIRPRETIDDVADIRKGTKVPVARRAIRHREINSPDWIPKITRKRGGRTERLL